MSFFQRIVHGWDYFVESLRILIKYPFLMVPLFVSWIIFATVIVLLSFYHPYFYIYSLADMAFFYLVLLLLSLVICFGNVFMLELVQQIGSKKRVSFSKALIDSFTRNLFAVAIIAVVWSIVWFLIAIARTLASPSEGGNGKGERSARGAARALGGVGGGAFNAARVAIDAFEKAFRMAIFMTLPAVAWENKGPFSAFKRAGQAAVSHPVEFAVSYSLTGIASLFMAIPLVVVFILDATGHVFPTLFWVMVIAYEGVIWATSIYLEQMNVSLVYLDFLYSEKYGAEIVSKEHLLEKAAEIISDSD